MLKLFLSAITSILVSIFVITIILPELFTNTLTVPFFPQNLPPTPKITLPTPPIKKILENDYHIFQTFNNCGPAALSMALSYYGIKVSQQKLGVELRPYQNPKGINDDKSVTLEELGEKSKEYGLTPYHRPNGNLELIKLFIAYDIPVLTRTLTKVTEDIGHYRIVKGYNESTGQILQDDSLQGKNLWYSFKSFNNLWKAFNYEYLVLVPDHKKSIAQEILSENINVKTAWEKAAQNSRHELDKNPSDIYAGFNLSVALYNIGDFQGSTQEFERVEKRLPIRALWYQIEPIKAYFELGNYERVFFLTDKILNNHNRAFSELYLIRRDIYKNQGKGALAKAEFEKAVFYNRSLNSTFSSSTKFTSSTKAPTSGQ